MKKICVSSRSHIYSLENYFTGGRWRLAWRVLALADENYRGEPHEILSNVLKIFSTLNLHAEKKKGKFRTVFQNIVIIGQFKNCSVLQPEEKQNWNNRRSGQTNSNFFNNELVSSFFPVNLSGGQFFMTAENRHVKLLKSLHFR